MPRLWGVTSVQIYDYFTNPNEDSLSQKLVVSSLLSRILRILISCIGRSTLVRITYLYVLIIE
jgi:hypothetical protein